MKSILITIAVIATAAIAHADDDDYLDPDPPVREVVTAAIRHAGLDGDPSARLRRRARWAGLVPRISVRAARDLDWSDDAPDELDHGEVLEVRATWHLDRLIFDPSESRALGLAQSRARARRDLTREVIHLYFRRQRLRADPAADPLELAEVTAVLDELTGGRLTRR
jgi:hypothetical protein